MTTLDRNSCPEAVRSSIDAFLDRVEQALLVAGITRPTRASVIETLTSHVLQQLSVRTAGRALESNDINVVLQSIGCAPPGNVATGALATREWRRYVRSLTPHRSRCAFWGALCIAVSLLPMIAILCILSFFSPQGVHVEAHFPHDRVHAELGTAGSASTETVPTTLFRATTPDGFIQAVSAAPTPLTRFWWLFAPLSPLALAGTFLGWIALLDIARSRGKTIGWTVAFFDALFYPVLLALLTLCLFR